MVVCCLGNGCFNCVVARSGRFWISIPRVLENAMHGLGSLALSHHTPMRIADQNKPLISSSM
jgi:hypothetical protein